MKSVGSVNQKKNFYGEKMRCKWCGEPLDWIGIIVMPFDGRCCERCFTMIKHFENKASPYDPRKHTQKENRND